MTSKTRELFEVRKIDGKYRVQKDTGLTLALSLDDWREALKQMEMAEQSEGWLDD
jgi:hypothetical protein